MVDHFCTAYVKWLPGAPFTVRWLYSQLADLLFCLHALPHIILFMENSLSPQMFAQTLLILQGPVRLFPLRSFPWTPH